MNIASKKKKLIETWTLAMISNYKFRKSELGSTILISIHMFNSIILFFLPSTVIFQITKTRELNEI